MLFSIFAKEMASKIAHDAALECASYAARYALTRFFTQHPRNTLDSQIRNSSSSYNIRASFPQKGMR